MAKTFKNLPRPGQAAAPKPTSERDFFDLSDEQPAVKKATEKAEKKRNIGNTSNTNKLNNTDNTSNNSNSGNIGNTALPVGLASQQEAVAAAPTSTQAAVRQTFVLSRGHLEQLRDYVHARRAQGDYTYSQKQALQQALELLFALDSPVPPRPAHTREQEQQHRERIRQGRRSQSSD